MREKPKMERMVIATLFLKGGTRTQNIARMCLNKDGQNNKSDNTTHLPGKTIPMKLHLQTGDDGRRPDFREATQAHRQLYKEHVESTGEGIDSIHIQHTKQDKISTTILWFRGVQLHGSPSNWMEISSFNKFVFILSVAAER